MKHLLPLVALLAIIACNAESETLSIPANDGIKNIRTEESVENVFFHFAKGIREETKSNPEYYSILKIKPLLSSTKANAEFSLYEVAFNNEQTEETGFSLIGGFSKDCLNVIAFVPQGHLSDTTFNKGLNDYYNCLKYAIPQKHIETKDGGTNMIGNIFYDADYAQRRNIRVLSDEEAFKLGSQSPFVYDSSVFFQYRQARIIPEWGQHEPYNNKAPLSEQNPGRHFPIGCGPIALGQLFSYYRYPANYNWDSLLSSNRIFKENTERAEIVSSYLYDIAQTMKVNWKTINNTEAGSATMENTLNAIEKYGYTYETTDFNNTANYAVPFWDYIGETPTPMLMRANDTDGLGHIWVIDGVLKQERWYGDVCNDVNGNYNLSIFPVYGYLTHCNWGWNGIDNGWYYDFYTDWWLIHFKTNKTLIYNIKPE